MIVWDRGGYEQGGRVPWPQALDARPRRVRAARREAARRLRAAAHRRAARKPQWLLIKRRDEHARPGSDIVAERPESVASGRTLEQLLGERS